MRFATVALIWGLLLMTPAWAAAQSVTTFEDLGVKLDVGETAHVSLPDGRRFSGRVVTLTRDAIELESATTRRRFAVAEVVRVAVDGDSVRNGALIGLVAGGALGAFMAGSLNLRAADAVEGGVILGGVGAVIGFGMDALIRGTTVVYRAPRPRASLAPILAPRTVGLTAAFRW